jgi:hypothetical protein
MKKALIQWLARSHQGKSLAAKSASTEKGRERERKKQAYRRLYPA